MTPTKTDTPSAGAMRAAASVMRRYSLQAHASCVSDIGRIIDRDSGLRELERFVDGVAAGMGNLPLDQIGPDGVHGPGDGKARAIYLESFVKRARELRPLVKGGE